MRSHKVVDAIALRSQCDRIAFASKLSDFSKYCPKIGHKNVYNFPNFMNKLHSLTEILLYHCRLNI